MEKPKSTPNITTQVANERLKLVVKIHLFELKYTFSLVKILLFIVLVFIKKTINSFSYIKILIIL